jgi:hypothetical protein
MADEPLIDTPIYVHELIALLQKLPTDLPVYLGDWTSAPSYDHPLLNDDNPRIESAVPMDRSGKSRPLRVVIGRGRL